MHGDIMATSTERQTGHLHYSLPRLIGVSLLLISSVWVTMLCAGDDSASRAPLPVLVELFEEISPEKKSSVRPETPSTNNDDDVDVQEDDDGQVTPLNRSPDKVYGAPAFGFHRLPRKYDQTGVRVLHKGPMLFRASATLTLEKGEHRILIRSRDDAKLRVDGDLLVEVDALRITPDGHNPLLPIPELVSPMLKRFEPGNVEGIATFVADGRPHVFTLETTVGRSNRRPELGVLAVAVAGPNQEAFTLLASDGAFPFSDEAWAQYTRHEESQYARLDGQERQMRAAGENAYWEKRHRYARQWLGEQPRVEPPAVGRSMPVYNDIDRFIGRGIEVAALRHLDRESAEREARSQGIVLFDADIKPILANHCWKCHGEKEKGSLRLDSRAAALRGGASGEPAFIAGDPSKSPLLRWVTSQDPDRVMPPSGEGLSSTEIALLSKWIEQGGQWASAEPPGIAASRHPSAEQLQSADLLPLPVTEDLAFLRRVTLDTVGVIPSLEEIRAYQADGRADKRRRAIERLLADSRWADHWVPFWQDRLAENPNIVKPNLNNTGAFRWWIHESFLDNKSMDRFVSDLVRMRGDRYVGPAGFGMATQNDAPMAAKAHILGGTFLGVQMKCARCHDAPFQSVKQADLFSVAAMLERKPLKVPASSIVPADKLSGRRARVTVSLNPEDAVDPAWPFHQISDTPLPADLMRDPKDPREVLSAYMTAPANGRFAKVMVNWVWKRYFGRGLVEPADDWENADVTHPQLLAYLAQELVGHGYDIKHVCRLILNSHTYQRAVLQGENAQAAVLFVGHTRRRMTAEQIVDSLHLATDRQIASEELNMDHDGRRPIRQFINLGTPRRAWEFTSLSNERDRPSLTLPHAQVYVDVLEAYGWNGSRQNPIFQRDHETNVLQPAALANGIMSQRLTRLSDGHPLTRLALEDRDVGALVDMLFLKTLSRPPSPRERETYAGLLRDGYEDRVIPESERCAPQEPPQYPYVSWSNHLSSEANEIKEAIARDIEAGEPVTRYLREGWRQNMEDGLWALINSPEMVFVP